MSDDSRTLAERREIRRQERANRRAFKRGKMDLKQELARKLPVNLMPGNVGDLAKVAWPFWFQANFVFGVTPTWSAATNQTQSFQVTQEAAFLMMGLYRDSFSYSTAGELAPLLLQIRDRQSSRLFMDKPMPWQTIGKKSRPSVFQTPMLVMPNAFIDVTLTSFATNQVAAAGSTKQQISFFGYRVRVEDADKVLSSVFGK